MKCDKVELYIPEYLNKQLNFVTHQRIQYHLKNCYCCAQVAKSLSETIGLLEKDQITKVNSQFWQNLKTQILTKMDNVPVYWPQKQYYIPRPLIAIILCTFLIGLYLIYSAIISPQTKSEKNFSLFSMNFFHDTWDFSASFKQIEKAKLAKMSSQIEEIFKSRLREELSLDDNKAAKLFPILVNFGDLMRKHYARYSLAMKSLNMAVQNGEQAELEKMLTQVQNIRQDWQASRWSLLQRVQKILSKEQFARFLIFAERLPIEFKTIYAEAKEKKQQG